MPDPIDLDAYLFELEQTTKRIERSQRKARLAFQQRRELAEALIRRDLKAWAAENLDAGGRLKAGASMAGADAIVQRRMDDFLRDVTGSTDWPPRREDFARGPSTMKGLATEVVEEVDGFREKVGLGGPTAEEYVRTPEARAVWEDHKLNPVGVRERETRQLREDLRRMRASKMPAAQVGRTLDAWKMDEGVFKLSTDSHALAYGRNYLERIGRDVKADRFVAYVSEPTARGLRPGGRTSSVAFRTFTREQLETIFGKVNQLRRGTTSFSTMGLGHGTRELYFPVPASIADDVVAAMRERRSSFIAQKKGEAPAPKPFGPVELRAALEQIRLDLVGEGLTADRISEILSGLESFASRAR